MRTFLEAVLSSYEIYGVDELGLSKIGDFPKVTYVGTNGARCALEEIPQIIRAFMDIQAHLYTNEAAAISALKPVFGGTIGGTIQIAEKFL